VALRRRRRKLTTTLTNVDRRLREVERRRAPRRVVPGPASITVAQLAEDVPVTAAAVNATTGTIKTVPPATYKRVIAKQYKTFKSFIKRDKATLTTDIAHELVVGDNILVSGLNSQFDLTAPGTYPPNYYTSLNHTYWVVTEVPSDYQIVFTREWEGKDSATLNIAADTVAWKAVTTKAITSNVVTLTIGSGHTFIVGDRVNVDGVGEEFDGNYTITAKTATTVSYKTANDQANISAVAGDGGVYPTLIKYVQVGDTWSDPTDGGLYSWTGLKWEQVNATIDAAGAFIPDDIAPKIPTSLAGVGTAYYDVRDPRARVVLTWVAPTLNVDDTAIEDLVGYDIFYRTLVTDDWKFLISVTDLTYTHEGLKQNVAIRYAVKAYDKSDNRSDYSAEIFLTTPVSVVVVNRPSAPQLTTRLGTVTVRWNGLDYLGNVMGDTFAYIEIHRSTTSGFTPSTATAIGKLFAAPELYVDTDLTYATTYYYKFIAVNLAGGVTTASTQSSTSVNRLVDTDLIANTLATWPFAGQIVSASAIADGSIDVYKIANGAVNAEKILANAVTELAIAANAVTSAMIQVNAVTSSQLGPNAVTQAKIADAAISAAKIGANAVEAGKIAANAVDANALAANAVILGKIGPAAVAAGAIAANAVDANALAANAVILGKIGPNAVAAGAIAANAVTLGSIAANAVDATAIAAAAITNTKIAANAVTAATIQAGAITAGKIDANAITANELAANAITAVKIAANAITAGKIDANAVTAATISAGSIEAGKIAANAVTAATIEANAITAGKLAANAVTAATIAANAITTGKIDAGAVTAGSIAANAVTAATIEANAITAGKLAANAVTAATIAANAITTGKIDAGAVTAATVAANAITAGSIAANAVTATTIDANAITAGKIAANAVVAGSIAAGAVTANQIAANAITAAKIVAGTISATEIAANAISSDKIAANAIGANQIAAGAIIAGKIGADAITANTIAANAISAGKIAANAIDADAINAGAITGTKISADAIDGKVITGATVRTGSSNPKVQMDTAGMRFTNVSGVNVLDIVTSTGAATFKGSLSIGVGTVSTTISSTTGSVTMTDTSTFFGGFGAFAVSALNIYSEAVSVQMGAGGITLNRGAATGTVYMNDENAGRSRGLEVVAASGYALNLVANGGTATSNTSRQIIFTGVAGNPLNSIYTGTYSSTSTDQTDGTFLTASGGIIARRYDAIPLFLHKYSVTSSPTEMIRFIVNGVDRGGVNAPTSAISPSFRNTSDYRIKENIRDYSGSIDVIKSKRIRVFNLKDDPDKTEVIGFIAHEFGESSSELVMGEKDAVDKDGNPEYQSILTTNILPYVVGALKETILKVEELENRITTLEA